MPRTLTYAGKNLSDFSVWWDNSRIFNKPAKLFDSFSIPNRNGALLTSLKKFENIQIEYDCYIKDNFASNYADLVDYLTSFETYQRLENSEEPDTYRMGIFRAEISTETGQFLKDGRFTLVFDCKPQNFFNSGDEITKLENALIGNQWVGSDITWSQYSQLSITYSNFKYIFTGQETMDIPDPGASAQVQIPVPHSGKWTITLRVTKPDPNGIGGRMYVRASGTRDLYLNDVGSVTYTGTLSNNFPFIIHEDSHSLGTINAEVSVSLTEADADITELTNPTKKEAKPIFTYDEVGTATTVIMNGSNAWTYTPPTGASDSDGTLYVDCELMDCYLQKNDGTVENYNPYVTMADFPVLLSGSNTLYASNGTVYIKPRWWRL